MEKITIIIPVYNVEKYVGEAIESALNQTYRNLEIILVDDGSTDRSGEICDEYKEKDSRIKVFHQKNGGLPIARNTGLENTTGKYIIKAVDSNGNESEKVLPVEVTEEPAPLVNLVGNKVVYIYLGGNYI